MKGGFKKWLSAFLEGSAIARNLSKFADWIYSKLGSGVYSFIFGSYDTICETFDDSAIGSEGFKKRGSISTFISKNIENSVIINKISALLFYLSRLSMRVIGVFLMSFGLFTLAAQAMVYLITESESVYLSGIVALVLMLIGGVLLLSKKAFCTAVFESKLFGGLARSFCGFKERSFVHEGAATGKKNFAFILGLVFGVLSAFVNPLIMLVIFIGCIAAYIVIINTEFGYHLMLFLLPFLVLLPHPTILLAGLTVFTFFSYAIKLVRGKKYLKIELMDVLVVCFMFVMLLGGIISYGGSQSIQAAGIYTTLILGYFLTVGLVNSKEALKRTVAILGASLLAVSLIGLYQNFTGNASAEWIDTEMFDAIEGRVVSTFENPNMLGEYLILLLPILAGVSFAEKQTYRKGGALVCFAAGCVCLVYTWARGAWLGFLLAAVFFMLIWNRKAMALIVAAVVALPFAIPFLPESIVSRFASIGDLSDTSTNYRVYIWRGSVNLAADYALTGIGVGEEAFASIYPYYSFAGIETAPHAHNLFLQLFIEVGIFGFIAFMAVLICLLQNGFSLAKCGDDKEVRLIGCGALCGVIAALMQGMTDYIWYNYRVFFIFWIVIGIVSASRRIDFAYRKKKTAYSNANDGFAQLTV